jgi:asparagine synthase (glutamine-hydrolysing)
MFGLALLDLRSRRIVLARDRCGMKPLYYAATGSGFLLASEPGALLASGMVEPAPDWAVLDTYLAVGYTPPPRTCMCFAAGGPAAGRSFSA